MLADLRARYPHNPIFLLNAAQVHEVYRSDRAAALAVYRALVNGARGGSLREPLLAETWGHLGAAAQLTALAEPDRATDEARVGDRAAAVGAVRRGGAGAARTRARASTRSGRAIRPWRRTARRSRPCPPAIPATCGRAAQPGPLADARSDDAPRRRGCRSRAGATFERGDARRRARAPRSRRAAQAGRRRAPVPQGPRVPRDAGSRARARRLRARPAGACRCRPHRSSRRATTSSAPCTRPRPIARAPSPCTTPRRARTARRRRREALRSAPSRAFADRRSHRPTIARGS